MNRIKKIFTNKTNKVIPFLTAGYPNLEDTLDLVLSAEKAGADMVEIGMPFSDPLADGPIIQEASTVALENGVTINWILNTVAEIRTKSSIPLVLMGYINPILKFGMKKFLSECKSAGVDGLIIPDLPPEEIRIFKELASENGISLIMLVAPNTSESRIKHVSEIAEDLIYCVSILGITGSDSSNNNLESYLNRVDKNSTCPFVVGFGISSREDVEKINELSHGAVIGSAIIKKLKGRSNPANVVYDYIKDLKND